MHLPILLFPLILTVLFQAFAFGQINLWKEKKAEDEASSLIVSRVLELDRPPGGIAYDSEQDLFYIYGQNGLTFECIKSNGTKPEWGSIPYETGYLSEEDQARRATATTSLGLDFNHGAVTLGKTKVPKNSLLVFNGMESEGEITAVDKRSGRVLASLNIERGRYSGGV